MKTIIYLLMLAYGLLPVHPESLKPVLDYFYGETAQSDAAGEADLSDHSAFDRQEPDELDHVKENEKKSSDKNQLKAALNNTDAKIKPDQADGSKTDKPLKTEDPKLDFDSLRQSLEKMTIRLEEGEKRLERRYHALINQREKDWMAKSAWLDEKRKTIAGKLVLVKQADDLFRLLQQQMAKQKPDLGQPPEEIKEYLIGGDPLLSIQSRPASDHQGAPGGGPGFARACPAFDQQAGAEDFEDWNSIQEGGAGLEGTSGGLIMPAGGYVSAGTWTYPNGGLHLGMDLALAMFTPVRAPADGIILYAAAVTGDAGGYLGNWTGWPYGGGNTIAMICKSQSHLYGVTFCHLSSRIVVRAGQQVHQGDILAYSGNTGNSTGPHTHFELFDLKVSLEEAVAYFRQGADFAFGTGWSAPATCSPYACRLRPELYFGP